jgi:hypothetical protein
MRKKLKTLRLRRLDRKIQKVSIEAEISALNTEIIREEMKKYNQELSATHPYHYVFSRLRRSIKKLKSLKKRRMRLSR